MRDEPAGTAGYAWHSQSPDYHDDSEIQDDVPLDSLIQYLGMAEEIAEDPDIPADIRHHCERIMVAIKAEIALRQDAAE